MSDLTYHSSPLENIIIIMTLLLFRENVLHCNNVTSFPLPLQFQVFIESVSDIERCNEIVLQAVHPDDLEKLVKPVP